MCIYSWYSVCVHTYQRMSQRRSTNSSASNLDSVLLVNGGLEARQLRAVNLYVDDVDVWTILLCSVHIK